MHFQVVGSWSKVCFRGIIRIYRGLGGDCSVQPQTKSVKDANKDSRKLAIGHDARQRECAAG